MRIGDKRRAKEKRAALIEKCAIALGVTVAILWAYGYGLMVAHGGPI
jgi:hypothetical protein